MKELYFFIKDGQTDEIFECYTFTFKYGEEGELKNLPTSEAVIERTQQVLNSIQTLNNYDKLPNDIKFEIEVKYHDCSYC